MAIVEIPLTRLRQPEAREPLVVMLHRWYLESRSAIQDLLVMIILGGGTFALLITHDFTEVFFDFTRRFEHVQMDEVLFTLIFILAIFLPAFALRRWQDAIRFLHQSNTDSLTELPNRRRGWRVLQVEFARAHRNQSPLSVIMFDIDHFKRVNDRYGHLKGDDVLESVSQALVPKMRANDTLVRWGGEEFLVILADTDRANAANVAERLRQAVEHDAGYEDIRITASFGVAQWQPGQSPDLLIQAADQKLYAAKEKGRNRVE